MDSSDVALWSLGGRFCGSMRCQALRDRCVFLRVGVLCAGFSVRWAFFVFRFCPLLAFSFCAPAVLSLCAGQKISALECALGLRWHALVCAGVR